MRATIYLGWTVGSRPGLRSVRLKHHAEHVQDVEPQEDHIFPASYLHSLSISFMSVFA
jgi:hypothetical protein